MPKTNSRAANSFAFPSQLTNVDDITPYEVIKNIEKIGNPFDVQSENSGNLFIVQEEPSLYSEIPSRNSPFKSSTVTKNYKQTFNKAFSTKPTEVSNLDSTAMGSVVNQSVKKTNRYYNSVKKIV